MSKQAELFKMVLYLPKPYLEVLLDVYQAGRLSSDGDIVEAIEAMLALAED